MGTRYKSENCKHENLMRHEYHSEIWWQCDEGCDFLFRAAPEPTPAAPPAWDRRDQSKASDFERWWMRESTSSPLGDAMDQVDIHTQALIVAFCKSAWLAAAPRPALSPDAAASSGDDKGEGR